MNPYSIDHKESNLLGPITSLKILYDEMPATTGCERCAEVNGVDKKDWCCRLQSPSMYYVEFLHVWQEVQQWSKKKKKELVLRAIRNYLYNSLSKGCIFYDKGCLCYKKRPFVCRMYGVIPEESWNKRWESLRNRQGDIFEAKPQCNLVSAANREPITAEEEEKWFLHINKCEQRIGMDAKTVKLHDLPGGSYRTFHDHLLLELFSEDFLHTLTKSRINNPSEEDIDKFIQEVSTLL